MFASILQTTILIFIILLLIFIWKVLRNILLYLSYPGPPVDWLLRHEVSELSSPNDKVIEHRVKWHRRYPRICRFFIGPIGYISLAHPESIKEIIKSKSPKPSMYKQAVGPWIGDGLLLSCGCKWLRHRRMLTNAFHFDILHSFMPVYTESTAVMLDLWEKTSQREGYIVLQDFLPYLTLDILLQCIGSVKTNCQVEKEKLPYVKDVGELTRIAMLRYANILYYFDWYFYRTADGEMFRKACQRSQSFVYDLILTHRNFLKRKISFSDELDPCCSKPTNTPKDFISILLTTKDEDGKGLTNEEISDEVSTFVFEGHDTTATGITWVLYYLAKFPEFQEMCRKEILEFIDWDDFKSEDLSKLTFFTMFIKETLRLRPPVHTVARTTDQSLIIDDYKIPKGTFVHLAFYHMHWSPEIWPDPFKFDPYRFSPDNVTKIDPYSYLPFSVGERNCIGQNLALDEIKTVALVVLKAFELSLHPSISDTPIQIKKDILFKPETPIMIVLKKLS